MNAPLEVARARLGPIDVLQRTGAVREVVGTVVRVEGLAARVGDLCEIAPGGGHGSIPAEVVGFRDASFLLMPYDDLEGIAPGSSVTVARAGRRIPVSDQLLGRVIDPFGRPMDGGPLLVGDRQVGRQGRTPNAMSRLRLRQPQQTGVRAIDAMLPCAQGQRMGIFAGSGVGKSMLLGMISRHTDADVNVVALVGERGREVREFVEDDLGPEGLARSVVIVATNDQSPVLRVRAAQVAMSVAEWFRDSGRGVMLLMDSVTRFAMAQREIGLAIGEPPATKGYPPSTFVALARLLERAGASDVASMTAFFTVLAEGDDLQDPVADAVRSIVDGHIVLSRDLARKGHYPAIDVMGSVSRLAPRVSTQEQMDASRRLLHLMKLIEDNEDLVSIGAYVAGTNPELDRALELRSELDAFLRQGLTTHMDLIETRAQLLALGERARTR